MKVYLWYSRSTCVTGKALASALGCECGINAPKHQHDVVITWGAIPKTVTERVLVGKRVLNNPFIIKFYSNKCMALHKLQLFGVSVPKTSQNPFDLTLPILRRPDYHCKGRGFALYRTEMPVARAGYHFMQFIISTPRTREYRVHVFKGEVIKVSRKVAVDDTADQECRSHDHGWRFSLCDIDRTPDTVKEQAIKACAVLGYDFGGVDVIYTPHDVPYVLEVNSGIGLDGAGLALYAERIQKWIDTI